MTATAPRREALQYTSIRSLAVQNVVDPQTDQSERGSDSSRILLYSFHAPLQLVDRKLTFFVLIYGRTKGKSEARIALDQPFEIAHRISMIKCSQFIG